MDSFLESLKQLGPSRLGMMAAIFVGLLMFFVFVSLRVSTPEMTLLYADLSTPDAGAIAAELEKNEISYNVSSDGTRIVVPDSEVGRARLLLAEAGLPNGGSLGYELFDEQNAFGTTSFVQNINQVRALEGELGRTISSMSAVRSARIHLVLPQRELFSREERKSSASVFLGLRPGAALPRQQILAIQSLVASAVPDLKITSVSIIDNNGNLLARGDDQEINLASAKAEEMRQNYETRLKNKIESQIGQIVGFGKVQASITAEINFDKVSTSEELFDPATQVVRSSQVTEESSMEREPLSSDVSVENNLPGIDADILGGDKPSAENNSLEEITNFEINKTIRSTVREVGQVKKLSIAILVDGRYIKDEEGNTVYEPRSEEELDQIKALVRSAAGFDEERGDLIEVVNLQFADIDTDEEFIDSRLLFGFEKNKILEMVELMTVVVMIILVILLVLQPMVNRILTTQAATNVDEGLETDLLTSGLLNPALTGPDSAGGAMTDGGGDEAEEEESLINISGVEGKVKASSLKKIEEIVESYPAETIAVIRSWMAQESS